MTTWRFKLAVVLAVAAGVYFLVVAATDTGIWSPRHVLVIMGLVCGMGVLLDRENKWHDAGDE